VKGRIWVASSLQPEKVGQAIESVFNKEPRYRMPIVQEVLALGGLFHESQGGYLRSVYTNLYVT